MASLTNTAVTARKIIRYSLYGIIILIVGRVVLGGVVSVYKHFFPDPPPKPTVLFGSIPALPFPANRVDPSKLTYTLETPQGGLPVFLDKEKRQLDQLKVYLMPKDVANLFSVQEGLTKARQLGFTNEGQKLTETLYKFQHQNVPKTLELNVVSHLFSLSYNLAADTSPIDSIPPTPEIAASQARSYLSSAGLLPTDLLGPTASKYLRVQEGKLVPVSSLSEGQLVEINLFRGPYDEIPGVGPDPGEANVWFVVSGSTQNEKRIVAGEFHYFPVDKEKFSTYPIKTTQQAWADLNAGKAFIAKAPAEGNVTIRRVYLSYYDPDQPSDYYQPIIVFEGDDFFAYVPAVTDEYYGK